MRALYEMRNKDFDAVLVREEHVENAKENGYELIGYAGELYEVKPPDYSMFMKE